MAVSIATSISDVLSEGLSKPAVAMERSKRYLINKAIDQFVKYMTNFRTRLARPERR